MRMHEGGTVPEMRPSVRLYRVCKYLPRSRSLALPNRVQSGCANLAFKIAMLLQTCNELRNLPADKLRVGGGLKIIRQTWRKRELKTSRE